MELQVVWTTASLASYAQSFGVMDSQCCVQRIQTNHKPFQSPYLKPGVMRDRKCQSSIAAVCCSYELQKSTPEAMIPTLQMKSKLWGRRHPALRLQSRWNRWNRSTCPMPPYDMSVVTLWSIREILCWCFCMFFFIQRWKIESDLMKTSKMRLESWCFFHLFSVPSKASLDDLRPHLHRHRGMAVSFLQHRLDASVGSGQQKKLMTCRENLGLGAKQYDSWQADCAICWTPEAMIPTLRMKSYWHGVSWLSPMTIWPTQTQQRLHASPSGGWPEHWLSEKLTMAQGRRTKIKLSTFNSSLGSRSKLYLEKSNWRGQQ